MGEARCRSYKSAFCPHSIKANLRQFRGFTEPYVVELGRALTNHTRVITYRVRLAGTCWPIIRIFAEAGSKMSTDCGILLQRSAVLERDCHNGALSAITQNPVTRCTKP
jgi:hypothetical protein